MNGIGGEYSTHGRDDNVNKILVRKPEGKKPLGWPRHRWEDNIRMDLSEIGWEGVNRMHVTQNRDQWRTL
jgi:hypothetical protein